MTLGFGNQWYPSPHGHAPMLSFRFLLGGNMANFGHPMTIYNGCPDTFREEIPYVQIDVNNVLKILKQDPPCLKWQST